MAFAFDSLGYAKKLRDVGVPRDQAEAAREFIMTELATRCDLDVLRRDLDVVRRELESKMDNLGLRLTVRLGVMMAAGLSPLGAVLGTLIRLHS
jgi:hypothetical protein